MPIDLEKRPALLCEFMDPSVPVRPGGKVEWRGIEGAGGDLCGLVCFGLRGNVMLPEDGSGKCENDDDLVPRLKQRLRSRVASLGGSCS